MSITFKHPYVSPTLTLTLRDPDLGNSESRNSKTRFRKSMDGTQYSYIRDPFTKRMLLNFLLLSVAEADNFIAFIKASTGTDVEYTDHLTVAHKVRIKPRVLDIASVGRHGSTCVQTSRVTLELEVVT